MIPELFSNYLLKDNYMTALIPAVKPDVVEDEDEDFSDLVPQFFSDEVLDFITETIPPFEMTSDYTDDSYVTGIHFIYESCLETDTLEDVYDQEKYVSDLESLVYSLWNQRNFLLTILANNQDKTARTPPGMWSSVELVNKMVLFCITGRDFSVAQTNQKLYTTDQYESLLVAYDYFPKEWRPRAATFIQKYAANYFQTEFATP